VKDHFNKLWKHKLERNMDMIRRNKKGKDESKGWNLLNFKWKNKEDDKVESSKEAGSWNNQGKKKEIDKNKCIMLQLWEA